MNVYYVTCYVDYRGKGEYIVAENESEAIARFQKVCQDKYTFDFITDLECKELDLDSVKLSDLTVGNLIRLLENKKR